MPGRLSLAYKCGDCPDCAAPPSQNCGAKVHPQFMQMEIMGGPPTNGTNCTDCADFAGLVMQSQLGGSFGANCLWDVNGPPQPCWGGLRQWVIAYLDPPTERWRVSPDAGIVNESIFESTVDADLTVPGSFVDCFEVPGSGFWCNWTGVVIRLRGVV